MAVEVVKHSDDDLSVDARRSKQWKVRLVSQAQATSLQPQSRSEVNRIQEEKGNNE